MQELGARAAIELGERLVRGGHLPAPAAAAKLRLPRLVALVHGAPTPQRPATPAATTSRPTVGQAGARGGRRTSAPLPAAFRLTPDGVVVPAELGRALRGGSRGAGGGRGTGRVHAGPDDPKEGSVLVVRTLDPDLAAVLPRLGGLVAETGNVLSHLAILARELGVPAVVGVQGAVERFPPGSLVLVDGDTGEVELLEHGRDGAA